MENIENNKLDYEDIRTRIIEYTRAKDFNYALLIKGEWGIGKTYFVRNNILKNLNDDISSIYISLFGVNSISELNELISTEILFKIFDKQKLRDTKIGKITKIIGKPALNIALKKLAIDKEDLPLPSEITELIPNQKDKNFLFVFDDLERTSCDIKDILGFINSFIEQYKAKVLIIGNINKLGKNKDEDNTTQKDDNLIEIPNEQKLFSYYKEKLIGFEICYNPNFNEVIESFVNSIFNLNNVNTSFNVSKVELTNLLISLFNGIKKKNLRKLQRITFLANQLIKELMSNNYSNEDFTKEYRKIFLMVSIIRIFLTTYNLIYTYNLQTIPEQWKILVEYTNFSYIQEFVNSSIIKKVELNKDIKNFIDQRKWEEQNDKDPLLKLKNNYYILNSEKELNDIYNEMVNQIKFYIPKQIPDLLILVSQLEKNNLIKKGAIIEITNLINTEINSLNKSSVEDINFNLYFTFKDKKLPKDHIEIITNKMNEWNEIFVEKRNESVSELLIEYFVQMDMLGLKEYINIKFSYFSRQKMLLGYIDFEIIKTFLQKANPEQYQNFRGAVYECYLYENFVKNPKEIDIIKKIIEWCESNLEENQDKIILMQRRWLIDNFEKLLV